MNNTNNINLNLNNGNAKLVIRNFMGGQLILPMKPKIKILRCGDNKLTDMTPEESFISMTKQLCQIDKAKEILKVYGAEFQLLD